MDVPGVILCHSKNLEMSKLREEGRNLTINAIYIRIVIFKSKS